MSEKYKKIGYIVETAYENPIRFELDDKTIYKTKAQLRQEYNRNHFCSQCGNEPFNSDLNNKYFRIVPIFKEQSND